MTQEKSPFGDTFFQDVVNNKPYLKADFYGLAGSGKTYTATLLAIGLHQRIKSDKPIVMFDTEKSNKFLKPLFEKAGIKFQVKESRSLKDLKEAMKLCRDGYSDILLIDSISHVYENFLEGWKEKTGHQRLQFQDWGIIKPAWKNEFSDPLVRDPYHVIFCGRAGYEYDNEKNDETGKREIYKSGVKMKVEGETQYEPDVLVYMERFEHLLDEGKEVYRQATIVKDRSTLLDGKVFKNPSYEDFAPVIEAMLNNPVNRPEVEEGDVKTLFKTEEDKRDYAIKCKTALENIQGEITSKWPGLSAEDKKMKTDIVEKVFKTRSWTEVENMSLAVLEKGLETLKKEIKKVK